MARILKTTRLKFLLVLSLLFVPSFTGQASYYFLTPLKTGLVALPQLAARILDLDCTLASSVNSGTPVDGDAIGTLVDQAQTLSYTQGTTAQKPLYKTNQLNSKSVCRFDSSNDTRLTENTTLLSTATAFTIFAVAKVSSFPTPYRYVFAFKSALAGTSPTWGYSTAAGYKDAFFGADSGWMVWRATTITNTTSWNYETVTYDGTGGTTLGHYAANINGSAATLTSTTGNNGTTINVFGSYQNSATTHGMNGDVARFVVWNIKLSSTELTQVNTFANQQYGL